MQEKHIKKGFVEGGPLTAANLDTMQEMLCTGAISFLHKGHGHMVVVMPGVVHTVVNLQDCVKVAWDLIEPRNLHKYIAANRRSTPYFGSNNTQDFMSCGTVAVKLIEKLFTLKPAVP